jgi:hypothetical protein
MATNPTSPLSMENVLRDVHDQAAQRLRVDSEVTAIIEDVSVSVELDYITDSVEIGDASTGNKLNINSDGSIDVNAVIAGTVKNKYSEVTAVASAVDTLILTHTVAINGAILKIAVSGDNIATYVVKINGVTQDKIRTYFSGALNSEFNFDVGGGEGLTVLAGDVIQVRVTHNRPDVGDFNARLQYKEN